jgi:hypothetical protein
LGEDWPNWLIAKLVLEEAETLVEGTSEPKAKSQLMAAAGILQYTQELSLARNAQQYIDRGHRRARIAAWVEAVHDFSTAANLVPREQRSAFLLAVLLVQIGELDAYRQHCQTMLTHWKNTDNIAFADQIAKACLLTPEAVVDPLELGGLVETTLSASPEHPDYRFFLLLRGLHSYRSGEFAAAMDNCQACRQHNAEYPEIVHVSAAANAIEAMVQHRLGRVHTARRHLAAASRAIGPQFARLDRGGDLGNDWHDWLIAQILYREAEAQLGAKP